MKLEQQSTALAVYNQAMLEPPQSGVSNFHPAANSSRGLCRVAGAHLLCDAGMDVSSAGITHTLCPTAEALLSRGGCFV